MSAQFICPCCGQQLSFSIEPVGTSEYDSTDAIQRTGFDAQIWNESLSGSLKEVMAAVRNNPYSHGTDEYYRWNRGAVRAMDK